MEECRGGGTLHNLTIKVATSLYLLSILATACAAPLSETASSKECVERVLQAKIIRTDAKNHRFFVVSSKIKPADIKNNIPQLEKCFANTGWRPDWALSVFTDAKYAGYMDEKEIIPFHENNMWAKAYVLEYDQASKSLIKNPAINPQQILP